MRRKGRAVARKTPTGHGESVQPRSKTGTGATYSAYAIAGDGSRVLLDARSIVVNLDGSEIEIGLVVAHSSLVGQLPVAVLGEGLMVVGHADATSIHIGVEPGREGRLGAL